MGEYFKPWPRKVGVLTLLLALVAMAGWVRSFTSTDSFQWNFKAFGFGVVSMDNVVVVIFGTLNERFRWSFPEFTSGDFSTVESQSESVNWRWSFAGFRFGREGTPTPSVFLCFTAIAYSWVVIPLTLTSLWLLLSKPRKSNQKKTAEPISVDGT